MENQKASEKHLDLKPYGGIQLKWIIKEYGVMLLTGFKRGWNRVWRRPSVKVVEHQLSAAEEELCCRELVTVTAKNFDCNSVLKHSVVAKTIFW
jgi:hypothetical protein